MLQQMSSPASALGEVAALVRQNEGRVCDASSDASSDAVEDLELPQCKIRRNYSCIKCTFYTQNPRAYLVHTREVHFERIKIYDCPHCIYASKHNQKLMRHIRMVHEGSASSEKVDSDKQRQHRTDPEINMEDLMEEVEDTEDSIDVEEMPEETSMNDIEENGKNSNDALNPNSKYFSCTKCNYVTHIRARFTKHVKYHSMPMIKCVVCDFRTPYKWNLDRHMRNHGGSGSFNCSMCNFTADIKQSLTVHEMNHHSSPVGQPPAGFGRRRNRVGASDLALDSARLITREEDGSGDSRSSHSDIMGLQDIEMVSCNSESNDATAVDDTAKKDYSGQNSPGSASDDAKSQKQNRKAPRPIPQLIPLNASTPNQSKNGEPPAKRLKESTENKLDNLPDITIQPVKETKKKNNSFFDKLKERLLTETGDQGSLICKNCSFESKCLSEHSVHEKNCTVQSNKVIANSSLTMGSTRCQNCRHRCKSSADLLIHMQTCKQTETAEEPAEFKSRSSEASEVNAINEDKSAGPHPMENVVFVWNNIDSESSKFETPLDISISEDSTMPDNRNFDIEAIDESENMNLSPTQAVGKKVFKCSQCAFWASTASRFHVHIVGHLNKKPFECSLCKYKSNWRWDITKHIKLKSARDPEHSEAKVLMTDETGRRNYSKYNRFLAMPIMNEHGENEFHYIETNPPTTLDIDDTFDSDNINMTMDMLPLNLQTQHKYDGFVDRNNDMKKTKKTLWKCKKCNYRDPSKDALLQHVKEHSRPGGPEEHKFNAPSKKPENAVDPADLAYRCGHCNQLSNWKHVIQRHCRLKHDGVIKVITTVKPKPDMMQAPSINEIIGDTCPKCPFKSNDRKQLANHLQQHLPSPQSIFKCYFCPFFVTNEYELFQHLVLHGVNDPEDYISKAMGCKSPLTVPGTEHASNTSNHHNKRHKCMECPYETNSKSQYMYHEQFHRTNIDTPYKCPECNYSVSKRHLLHQHLRVHGIFPKKNDDADLDINAPGNMEFKEDFFECLDDNPYVWVSAKNEFHKMYKCRYCSYVHVQKDKIPFHEQIHINNISFDNNDVTIYKCLECKFTCDNPGRLAHHSKVHSEIYGRIYCPVEEDVPDEVQIAKLRKVIENEKLHISEDIKEEGVIKDDEEIRILFFCQICPARFFTNNELKLHDKFHDLSLPYKCKICVFSVSDETELQAHRDTHSDEYQTKTKMLKFMHRSHPAHREPRLELVHCPLTSDVTWTVSKPCENYKTEFTKKASDSRHTPKQYPCKECPAKFLKSSALSYHVALHGGEGEYKCKKCTYTVKNIGNLAKHEILHENEEKAQNCDYDSGEDLDYKNVPLSGTDLFQRKTEAQKRVLTDKDKLVKPNDHFPPVLQADPQFGYLMHGNPEFIYPTYLKNGRQKEKRYKCHKCPSAFEKREQYKIHLSLHGSKQRYKCELCDYSVKYYANYVQHMRKHQMNDEAQAERKRGCGDVINPLVNKYEDKGTNHIKLAIKTMPKSIPKTDFQQFSIKDQQTLRLLQRRRSINNNDANVTEVSPTKDRKQHICLLCPYTNQRPDALSNHYRRHGENDPLHSTNPNNKCAHCDLAVTQSHFHREHVKSHFNYQKTLTPECYSANKDVSFTITKVDENSLPKDLKLDRKIKYKCNEDKIFIKIKTGEMVVE